MISSCFIRVISGLIQQGSLLTDGLVLDLLMHRKNSPLECILHASGSNSINHFLVTVISGERDLFEALSCAQGEVRPLIK